MTQRDRDQLDGPSAAAWSMIAGLPSDSAEVPSCDERGGASRDQPFDLPEGRRYRRGLLLGEGGMGRVTQAFDQRLGREVALKEVIVQSPAHEARLAREAAITARLDHPGIVVVHDAGRTPEGTLFYTMRVVRGRPLDRVLKDAPDLDARLRLLRHVLHACEAVAFAHRHGVVHRDLKPSNIMLGEFGETQVLDWGLARALGETTPAAPTQASTQTPDDSPDLTRHGTVVGTPRYMSPEQARGAAPSPLADVWSLGAILFEVCAGRPLRDLRSIDSEALLAAATDPAVPSLRTVAPKVPRDLVALVERALAPAAWRYPDAKALAADLAAWLDGRRIAAHAYSPWELLRRVVRAWRVPLSIGLLALIATAVGLSLAFAEVDAERDRAVAAEVDARHAFENADAARIKADRALARMLSAKAVASAVEDARPEAEVLAAHAFALDPSPAARGSIMALARAGRPELIATVPLPPRCLNVDVTPDLGALVCGDDKQVALYDLTFDRPLVQRWRTPVSDSWGVTTFETMGAVVNSRIPYPLEAFAMADGARVPIPTPSCCTYPPRGNLAGNAVAFAGTAQTNVLTNDIDELTPCARREESAGAVDDSGRRWAVTCGDGALFIGAIGQPGERHQTPLHPPRGPASEVAFAADGKLVLGTSDGALVVYDPIARAVLHDVASGVMMTRQIAVSPDARWAVVFGDRGGPRIFDIASGTWRGRLPVSAQVRHMRFVRGRDADLVTFGAALQVWRLTAGDATSLVVAGGVTGLVLSPDGATLAVTRGKGVELRDIASGQRIAQAELDGITKPGSFSPDGSTFVATAGSTLRIQRWQVAGFAPLADLQAVMALHRAVVMRGLDDAPVELAAPHFSGVLLWPDAADTPVRLIAREEQPQMVDIGLRGDRRRAVMLTQDGDVLWLDAAAPMLVRAFSHPGALSFAVDAAADHVLLGERGGASLMRLDDGALVRFFGTESRALLSVAVSPDGRFVAGGDGDGDVTLWDIDGRVHAVLEGHARRVTALRFAADGRWLATGSWDETVRFITLDVPMPTPAAAEATWGITLDAVLR